MNNHRRNRIFFLSSAHGFSLVEVMVTMLIFSFLIMVIFGVLSVGQASWETNRAKIELQQNARMAMDWMIQDLRQSGDSSITDVPANGTWYTQITFKTPLDVFSGSIRWHENTICFVRGGTGGSQLQRIDVNGTKIIAQNIQTLQFRRQSSSPFVLEVNITAQKNSANGHTIQYPLSFNVQIRNT